MHYPITSLLSVISIWGLLHINGMDKKSHQRALDALPQFLK